MRMPFGAYKDKDLTEIPKPYLRWLREKEWVGLWLVKGIDRVLGDRPSKTDPPLEKTSEISLDSLDEAMKTFMEKEPWDLI